MTRAPVDRAVRVLERVFAPIAQPLCFRLWDGTSVRVGGRGESDFAIVFRSRDVFRRILRDPTPLRFGEAFITGGIDIEGDLFSAMQAATEVEELHLSLGTRLALLPDLLRT